jgi:hypothetical protein
MIVYEVPYLSSASGNWEVSASNTLARRAFASRIDALRYALDAMHQAGEHGDGSIVMIEGVDGRWRPFDGAAKGLA